jgi:flavin-dependent dehydrogenase
MNIETLDVVVLGGGPAGASAARHCARHGLETLLLERRHLPRDKVCSGMIMGPWAHDVIEDVFGSIPEDVLAEPKYLAGHEIHVAGAAPVAFPWRTPIAWRKDLDGWMVRGAVAAGARLWEGSRVVSMAEEAGAYRLKVRRDGEEMPVSARFLVGAEGAVSRSREALFPELRARYSRPMREGYRGSLSLERDRFHWFFPKARPRPRFCVHHKGDTFIIEGSGIPELRREIGQTLSRYGFDAASRPLFRDGCQIALLHSDLLSGRFRPAKGNSLLVGDAGGLILPITFEGIGSAVLSGRLAGEAILAATASGRSPAEPYVKALEPIIQAIARLDVLEQEVARRAEEGPVALAEALCHAYQETAKVQCAVAPLA